MKTKISISEIFVSVQGEGRTMGRPALFIRLGGCNLQCGGYGTEKDLKLHNGAEWRCDTTEVWRKSKSYTIEELMEHLYNMFGESRINLSDRLQNGMHVIITGGEPLMQMPAIEELIYQIRSIAHKAEFEVETNGTIMPTLKLNANVTYWNVSPKLSSSGMPPDKAIKKDVLESFNRHSGSIFKFVVINDQDMDEILRLGKLITMKKNKVWLMPAAGSRMQLEDNCNFAVQQSIKYCFNYSHRLQVSIWDKTTGV